MKKFFAFFAAIALLFSYSCTHTIYFDKTPVEDTEEDFVVPEDATVITYTTTDGKTIQAGVTKIANILSNKYKNGEGYIVINGTLEEIPEQAFYNFTTLKSITIPDGVTAIGNRAFYNCENLTNIVIPKNVTTIGEQAFYNCKNLTKITLPENIVTIGNEAFYGCNNLTITIAEGTVTITNGAFSGCSGITNITIPESVITIEDYAFVHCKNLTDVKIGNGVTSIGKQAFYGCSKLTSVTMGNSVISIDKQAFDYCDAITDVYISDLTAWCNIDFGSRSSNPVDNVATLHLNNTIVTDLVIPDEITTIKANTFCSCSSIISVTIPHTVTSIAKDVFFNCANLSQVYCKSITPPILGSNVFVLDSDTLTYPNLDCKIYVPRASVEAYKATDGWSNYADAIEPYDF